MPSHLALERCLYGTIGYTEILEDIRDTYLVPPDSERLRELEVVQFPPGTPHHLYWHVLVRNVKKELNTHNYIERDGASTCNLLRIAAVGKGFRSHLCGVNYT